MTHPFADVLGLLADGLGVADCVVCDGREELLLVLTVKRGLTHQHLIQEHAIGPPSIAIVLWAVSHIFKRDPVSHVKGILAQT